MNNFQLMMPKKVIFKDYALKEDLSKLILNYGNNVLLISGKSSLERSGQLEEILSQFKENKIKYHIEKVIDEPTCQVVDDIVKKYKKNIPNVIVTIGGGSVLDTGKAVSGMFYEEGSIADYLDVIGTKKPSGNKVPHIACPTTSGTGSEATKNAVIKQNEGNESKRSIRHDNYVPDVAILDPTLVLKCPPKVTMQSGLDAFSQLIESYTCTSSNDLIDALTLDGIKKMANNLVGACTDKANDIETRKAISYASFISGVGLANAGLASVHGMAGAIGGLFDAPHGAVCASLIWAANVINMQKIKDFEPYNPAAVKYAKIGSIFSGIEYDVDKHEVLFRAVADTLKQWQKKLNVPRLADFGVTKDDFWKILEKSSQKANPVDLTESEMENILEMSL